MYDFLTIVDDVLSRRLHNLFARCECDNTSTQTARFLVEVMSYMTVHTNRNILIQKLPKIDPTGSGPSLPFPPFSPFPIVSILKCDRFYYRFRSPFLKPFQATLQVTTMQQQSVVRGSVESLTQNPTCVSTSLSVPAICFPQARSTVSPGDSQGLPSRFTSLCLLCSTRTSTSEGNEAPYKWIMWVAHRGTFSFQTWPNTQSP